MAEYIDSGKLRLVEIKPEGIRKIRIVQLGKKTMGQWYAAQTDKPKYMINASLWDEQGSIGTIFLDGAITRNEGNGFGFGTTDGKTFRFAKPWDTRWLDYITGYPALIWDGKPTGAELFACITSDVKNSLTHRAAVAVKDGKLLLITGKGLTLNGFQNALRDLGVSYAINLDGGGSTRLLIDGVPVNDPTDDRTCKLAIAVWVDNAGEFPTGDNKEDVKMHKVFLGVGHGGTDSGAVSGGFQEKDMTLRMALACRDELTRHGVTVKLSRTTDENDPLTDEIKECNAFDPDLALDIHVNAGGGDGFEAFHTLTGGKGKILAQHIEAEVVKLGQNSRGIKTRANANGKDYYGFIRQTKAPAVIAEIGFIDNPTDRAAFDSNTELDAFGRAYARGILWTLGVEVKDETAPHIQILRDKLNLAEDTIRYLLAYQYGAELVKRIAEAVS